MRCTILAIGSRGDVHPLIALGAGLAAAGHSVCVATHSDFEADVVLRGMAFHALPGDAARFYSGPAASVLRDRTRNPREFVVFCDNYLGLFFQQLLVSCWEASQGADVILCWSWWPGIAPALAERLRVPVMLVSSFPIDFPTAAFANPFHGELSLGAGKSPEENLASWADFAETALVGHSIRQRWRQETLGIGMLSWQEEVAQTRQMPHLFGYSPTVLPKPADWPAWAYVTGYWLLDAPRDYTPPEQLAAFLESHPSPIALGFSSQVGRNAARITEIVIEALRQLCLPAILIAGLGGLKGAGGRALDLPELVYPLRSIPYDWLLAHCSAMVHHGGAGSAAMALQAGIPSMAVAFGYDQLMWGERIAAVGAGVLPIVADELTAGNLADAMQRLVDDGAIRHNAARIGELLRQEDGVGTAVGVIEQIAERWTSSLAV